MPKPHFSAALAGDPKDVKARFYLGQAYAQRRDIVHALALWQSLLADTPPNAPWRGVLLDSIATLYRRDAGAAEHRGDGCGFGGQVEARAERSRRLAETREVLCRAW